MIKYERSDILEGLMSIRQINQKYVCFVIIGIF